MTATGRLSSILSGSFQEGQFFMAPNGRYPEN